MASTLRTVCDSFKIRRCTVPETKPTNMCTWEIFKVVFNVFPLREGEREKTTKGKDRHEGECAITA